jgi:hypothetical protein
MRERWTAKLVFERCDPLIVQLSVTLEVEYLHTTRPLANENRADTCNESEVSEDYFCVSVSCESLLTPMWSWCRHRLT